MPAPKNPPSRVRRQSSDLAPSSQEPGDNEDESEDTGAEPHEEGDEEGEGAVP